MGLSSFSRAQTEKFSGAVSRPDSPSPVSMAAEADQDQEEEHENMKNLLISRSSTLNCDQRGLRRSRAVRSKTSSFLHLHTTPTITDCQRHVHLRHQFNFKAVRLVLLLLEMSVQPVKSDRDPVCSTTFPTFWCHRSEDAEKCDYVVIWTHTLNQLFLFYWKAWKIEYFHLCWSCREKSEIIFFCLNLSRAISGRRRSTGRCRNVLQGSFRVTLVG